MAMGCVSAAQLAVEHGLQFKAGFDKQYTLGNKLGSGLTGTVYKATNADGTEVAVKQVVKGSEGLRCEADYLELIHEIAVMQQVCGWRPCGLRQRGEGV